MRPFHLDMATTQAHCTHDIDHQWMTQHRCWNGGAMDKFLSTHLAFDQYTFDLAAEKVPNGPLTMGYYTRSDLAFYYALADNFTLCDNYHTSAITGSAANWLYAFTGMIDPNGDHGGPVLSTPSTGSQQDYATKYFGKMTWTTMMERLEAKGVTWKFYNSPDISVPALNDNFLTFFAKFFGPSADPNLAQKAFGDVNWQGSHPTSFMLDCQLDRLPQVSWLVAPEIWSEHPPAPPVFGEDLVSNIVAAVAGNPAVWKKTALFITWDDSGGWFDHVSPVTAPPGTTGEYLTAPDALLADRLPSSLPLPPEAHMPLGLGFRVPMLIVSPWTRNVHPETGPLIASEATTGEVFDHTSMLRFLETLFCVEAPNLTAWRRATVGDLTSAFNFVAPDDSVPTPCPRRWTPPPSCSTPSAPPRSLTPRANHGLPFPYKVPATTPIPLREALPDEARVKGPSGQVVGAACVAPAGTPGGGGTGKRTGGGSPNTSLRRPTRWAPSSWRPGPPSSPAPGGPGGWAVPTPSLNPEAQQA